MSGFHSVCTKEGWILTGLREIKEVKRSHSMGFLLTSRMDRCIDLPGDELIFCTHDANSGFWKVEIDDTDCDKTDLASHHGLFSFSRMSFTLCNKPYPIQLTMDVVLSVKWQFALVYLNDIFRFSFNTDQNIWHGQTVLLLLLKASITMELNK